MCDCPVPGNGSEIAEAGMWQGHLEGSCQGRASEFGSCDNIGKQESAVPLKPFRR